jgi:hypothetical protein
MKEMGQISVFDKSDPVSLSDPFSLSHLEILSSGT